MNKHEMIKAIERINQAYWDEDYDRYESLLDLYSKRFVFDRNLFEDIATDVRLFGWECC